MSWETDYGRAWVEERRPWNRMELEGHRHGRLESSGRHLKGSNAPPLVCGYRLECGRAVAKDKAEMGGGRF